jgi:hypothetical protein
VKKLLIIITFLLLAVITAVAIVRFLLGGNASGPGWPLALREDSWICSNGEWVKHGNPSAPKPEGQCGPKLVNKVKENLEDSSFCYSEEGGSMNFAKAKEIAEKECSDGKLKDTHSCNPNSGTWWIDFDPNEPKEGCNPACVVFVNTGTTEINWRCTGLVSPK